MDGVGLAFARRGSRRKGSPSETESHDDRGGQDPLAQRILGAELGPAGFDRAEVEAGSDHDGEAAFFIKARYGSGAEVPSGAALARAHGATREAMLAQGEQRFPYISHEFLDDLEPEDDEEGERAAGPSH